MPLPITVILNLFLMMNFFLLFIFPQFFACLVIFNGMLDAVYLILLSAIYFCTPINSVELCSVTQLCYLETLIYLWALLLSFVKQD